MTKDGVALMFKKLDYQPPANGYPEWNNNPDIFMLNRMDARAETFTPYDTFEEAVKNDPSASRRILSLNGMWKFPLGRESRGEADGF